jgi:hypothetical protein
MNTSRCSALMGSAFLLAALSVIRPTLAQAPATQPAVAPAAIGADSAKARVRDFLAAAGEGDTSKLQGMWFSANDKEKQMIKPGSEALVSLARMSQNMSTKFPEDAKTPNYSQMPTEEQIAASKEEVSGEVHHIKSATPGQSWDFPVVKVDGTWKISAADAFHAMPKEKLEAMTKAVNKFCDDLEAGKFDNAVDARNAVQNAISASQQAGPTSQQNPIQKN